MSVYVDDMEAPYGRMKMCHLIADSDQELFAMADRIGVARKWHQKPGTAQSHFDIALSKKALALAAGAIPITWKQAGAMCARRRVTGELGKPEEAIAWLLAHHEARKAVPA
ncbi:DUF4031 domain-containing protein [Burkholderia multivorans]|uniref:DUF4031 domain-containing protein n=1 Tax=Burkholderia multivorans TaxID=87883 RepID=UPI001C234D8A|nr:DUF4031 domain-containing protein [Burkholderia multivorans]MDN8078732.1 DUF4031 domain-containing protein [Burkholderia multivorans]